MKKGIFLATVMISMLFLSGISFSVRGSNVSVLRENDSSKTRIASTPKPKNPELAVGLSNEANTSVVSVNTTSDPNSNIETDIKEKTVPQSTQEILGSHIISGDLWANDSNYAKWNSTNETGNTNWVLNQSFFMDLDNYNISAANLNYLQFTIKSFVEGVNPDTTGKIRIWNANTSSWYAPGWTLSNSEQEFTSNNTNPNTFVNSNNKVEINALINDTTDTNYNYTVDQALITAGYSHNVSVNTLDFRQRADELTVKKDSTTKDLYFGINETVSNLNYMNWTMIITHPLQDQFLNHQVYNVSSDKWVDFTGFEGIGTGGSYTNTYGGGVIVANLTDRVTKERHIKVMLNDVKLPSFKDEKQGVFWTEDSKLTKGSRERKYTVYNPAQLTLENITWSPTVPTSAITSSSGANVSSLTIPGIISSSSQDVTIEYSTSGWITVEVKDKITGVRNTGAEVSIVGPGGQDYGGEYESGMFQTMTLPPGEYDITVKGGWFNAQKDYTITLNYNQGRHITTKLYKPPLWFVLLVVGTIAAVIAFVCVFFKYGGKEKVEKIRYNY